jgi:glycosyltransferase involved in cell wall biosynthesis
VKIVLLTTNIADGGAETQVRQLACRLRMRGFDTSVVSMRPPGASEAELEARGVPLYAPGVQGIPGILRRIRPDIVHAHMFHANVAARLLRLILPFRVVISTIHSIAESSRKTDRIRGRDLAYRLTDSLADAVVAVSRATASRHVAARAVSPPHLRVIPNGVDTALFRPAAVRTPHPEFTWLAVGRLMWKKDYPTLLRAFGEIGRGALLIAGTGPDQESLRAIAPPGVRFLGQQDDIAGLMRRVDGFVLSSKVEGLPLVLLEAAASGIPAVATDAGGVRETSPAYLVPPGDANALGRAMRDLMALTPEARDELGRRAREHAVRTWDWEVVVERWIGLYRELLPWT